MNRRNFLKRIGQTIAGVVIVPSLVKSKELDCYEANEALAEFILPELLRPDVKWFTLEPKYCMTIRNLKGEIVASFPVKPSKNAIIDNKKLIEAEISKPIPHGSYWISCGEKNT